MERKITKKNYFILILIFILTILLTLYLASWYNKTKNLYDEDSTNAFLAQIKIEEISSYLLENPNKIIYISSGNSNFETDFQVLIKDYELKNEVVSLKITDANTIEQLKEFIDDKIKDKIGLFPNILIAENGKIVDFLYDKKQEIKIQDVLKFLKEKEVILEDD